MRYVLTAHPATDALTVLPLIRFLERSIAAAVVWQIIGTQFGHEGESDLIRACPLGMPFYLLTDLVIKRSPIQTSRLILSTMVTSRDATTTMDIGWPLRCSCRPRMEQCVLLFLFLFLQQGGGTQKYFIFICTEKILRSRIKWRLEWQNHNLESTLYIFSS